MITANQITSNTTITDLASFLKFSSAGQFQLLNLVQVISLLVMHMLIMSLINVKGLMLKKCLQ